MTGVAATQLAGGTTVDKRLGIRRHDDPLKALSANKIKALKTLWGEAVGILIDEISMADSRMTVRFDRALKCITGSDRPFGGVHVVWSGDFNQKPPVAGGQPLYSPRSSRTRHAGTIPPSTQCIAPGNDQCSDPAGYARTRAKLNLTARE